MKEKERKPYVVLREYQRDGCRLVDIRCPFCNAVVTAHVWSLAGSGKKMRMRFPAYVYAGNREEVGY